MSSNTKDNRKPFEFFYDDGEYWFVHEDGETENVEHLGDMAGCYVEVAAAFEKLLGDIAAAEERAEKVEQRIREARREEATHAYAWITNRAYGELRDEADDHFGDRLAALDSSETDRTTGEKP